MSRAPCTTYVPTQEEGAAIVARLSPALARLCQHNSSRCDACSKIMEESEMSTRGYASGNELGLCRKCASTVNTQEAVGYAEKIGAKVYARPIFVQQANHAQHAHAGTDDA